jgi:hypothetical protein
VRDFRDAALAYADLGWHVLPLGPRAKVPLGRLVPNGLHDATADLAQVLRWWTAHPAANVGIACGASGLVVLDVDPRNGGDDALADLESELGELPPTVENHSGGGGVHLLFRHPGDSLVGQAAEGVDVKDRGYIVAPPSIHPSGQPYVWSVDGHPGDVALAELPPPWLARLRRPTRAEAPDSVNMDHGDELRRIPAATYVRALTGREAGRGGWVQCPIHKGGQERTPSFQVDGTIWACYACQPVAGKQVMGGNIYDLAAVLRNLPLPLRGPDFAEVRADLLRLLDVR